MKSAAQLFAESRQRITEISTADVRDALARGDDLVLIDIREPNEWAMGRIPGALLIARGVLESGVDARIPREKRIVLYCASCNRSALAAESLGQMGYTDVASMREGIKGWRAMGGDIEG